MSGSGSDYQRCLRDHYVPCLQEDSSSHRAVDWGSERGQQIRFQVLSQVMDLSGKSVIDAGCGIGHLLDYFRQNEIECEYTGFDALDEMVDRARQLHPNARFETLGIEEASASLRADVVLASGLMTFMDRELAHETFLKLWSMADVALAINVLSAFSPHHQENELALNPEELIAWARECSERWTIRLDYLPHDMTLYLYRGEAE